MDKSAVSIALVAILASLGAIVLVTRWPGTTADRGSVTDRVLYCRSEAVEPPCRVTHGPEGRTVTYVGTGCTTLGDDIVCVVTP